MDLNTPEDNTLDRNTNPKTRMFKTYRRRVRRSSVPEISEELVLEILLRLPVKTLARFKSVCKAWHAIIANPCFIRMHLQQSSSKHEQEPSFLITPHTLNKVIEDEAWPSTFSNKVPLYLWQEGQDSACLMHKTDFHGEFGSVYPMSHCDGLVMFPTDTKVYVFNPATSDVLKLPDAQKDVEGFQSVGLGLDPRTNTYKVVRFFYRKICFSTGTYDAGMEVCTIGGDDSYWRETINHPPYPLQPHTPKYFKGSLYWHIFKQLLRSSPQGFLRFHFEDESFNFIPHPSLASEGGQFDFIELGGELCLAQYVATQIVMWMSPSGDNGQWERLYVINLQDAWKFQPIGLSNGGMLLRRGNHLYRHDEGSQKAREVVDVEQLRYKNHKVDCIDFAGEDIYFFNIIPYIQSLVPLAKAR
uniref:F-box domain-containing protein n=1 Tax=Arundo donax TaxID=35708 RepID=A0A0A8YXK2_ARUDO